jgi:hypothetical protein
MCAKPHIRAVVSESPLAMRPTGNQGMIEYKDILEWCYVVGTLQFGVFGFLYSVFAQAALGKGPRPPITIYLRRFCRVIVSVLSVLTLMLGVCTYLAFEGTGLTFAGVAIWILFTNLVVVTAYSLHLAFFQMGYHDAAA